MRAEGSRAGPLGEDACNRNITTNEGQGLNKPWGPAADTESGGSMSRDAREEVTHK